ncbi:hypothetical protein V8E54_014501 [Elaphomyces granulatus]|jgi:hypothetical protein
MASSAPFYFTGTISPGWKLLSKIEEEPEQHLESGEAISPSCALTPGDPTQQAYMRIWMQRPFEGSEIESPTQELPLDAQDELDALQVSNASPSVVHVIRLS